MAASGPTVEANVSEEFRQDLRSTQNAQLVTIAENYVLPGVFNGVIPPTTQFMFKVLRPDDKIDIPHLTRDYSAFARVFGDEKLWQPDLCPCQYLD